MSFFPFYITGKWSDKNITEERGFGYCSAVRHDRTRGALSAVLLLFPDVLCLGLTLWASSSMVVILYRHKHRVQHIRRADTPTKFSPESRATKTILLLVSIFINFNTLSSISYIILGISNNSSLFISTMSAVVISCFPAISPFLLMSRDSRVSRLCFAGKRNANSPTLKRKV